MSFFFQIITEIVFSIQSFISRERRRIQLRMNDERERSLPPPRPRRQRLRFCPEVALLDATGRADAAEGRINPLLKWELA